MKSQVMLLVIAGLLSGIFYACNNQSPADSSEKIKKEYFNANDIQIHTKQGITYINQKIANGYILQVNQQNDTLFFEGYINGKKQGICYAKYPNLQYQYLQFFINGKVEGMQKTWWENGNLKEDANYKNDVFHGKIKEYDINGMLTRDNNYVDGHEDGKQKMWYDNGKLRANYVVKNGRMYGLSGTMNCSNAVEKKK